MVAYFLVFFCFPMLTPHSCFFRNHRRRDTFTSSTYCFRQRLARKRKPLWKTEKPGAGSQPGWRSVLGSLVGGSPGPVFCRGWRRPWGQRSWDVVALRPPALDGILRQQMRCILWQLIAPCTREKPRNDIFEGYISPLWKSPSSFQKH